MTQWISIILLTIAGCVAFGILHDMVTARICVEYFTIGHPPVFDTEDPTLLALGWGTIATWWMGVLLGVPVATAARLGGWPKVGVRALLIPLAILMAANAALATAAGCVGYVAAINGWVWLVPRLADRVPADKHVPFLVDLWAHNASYLGGVIGAAALLFWLIHKRRRLSRGDAYDPTSNPATQ